MRWTNERRYSPFRVGQRPGAKPLESQYFTSPKNRVFYITMGCGRLFEGTAEQMYANLKRICELPEDVRIYCGHEYTLANAHFAAHAEPGNAAVAERMARTQAQRDAGEITLPTTVGQERETNPFVRATNSEDFAQLRSAKDSFR